MEKVYLNFQADICSLWDMLGGVSFSSAESSSKYNLWIRADFLEEETVIEGRLPGLMWNVLFEFHNS